jgi:hypothetical protein
LKLGGIVGDKFKADLSDSNSNGFGLQALENLLVCDVFLLTPL